MARAAKIWRRKAGQAYYTTINGKPHRLAVDYQEAMTLFRKLKAKKKPTGKTSTTLEEVCNAFLDLAQKTKAPKTYENQKAYLQSFCDAVGKTRRVADIKGTELDDWSLSQGWAASTQAAARRTVMACFNWGVNQARLLIESPMWGMSRGRYERRERILKPEEQAKITAVVKGNLKDFLFFLESTGCRPFSEAGKVTAEMIDWKDGSITFAKHKTAKSGKRRVIYLAPALLERLGQLAVLHPEGPLMRTKTGREWNRPAAAKAMRRLERKAKVARLTPYAWRHTFITSCLSEGIPAHVVAELVGSSVRVISRYYSHIDQRKDVLREAANRAAQLNGCGLRSAAHPSAAGEGNQ